MLDVPRSNPGQEPFFAVNQLSNNPLESDGLIIASLHASEDYIDSDAILTDVLKAISAETVLLIPRSSLSENFFNKVRLDIRYEMYPTEEQWYSQWNRAAGISPANATPHIHGNRNCHVAPDPTECETAFFNSSKLIEAVKKVTLNTRHDNSLRLQLGEVIRLAEIENNITAAVNKLHTLHSPAGKSESETLRCVQHIQMICAEMDGVFTANLNIDGNGIVVIPPNSIHSRSLLDMYRRQEITGWRYFQS